MISNQQGTTISYETWLLALASSACIGFTSLVPWMFNMTFFERHKQENGNHAKDSRMKFLLSFALGAILGDIFLHLIPESFQNHIDELNVSEEIAYKKIGLSIISGIFVFIIVEMVIEKWSSSIEVNSLRIEDFQDATKNQPTENSTKILNTINNKDLTYHKTTFLKPADIFDKLGEVHENNNDDSIENLNTTSHEVKRFLDTDDSIETNKIYETKPRRRKNNSRTNIVDNIVCNGTDSIKKATKLIGDIKLVDKSSTECKIDVAGYLNLIANGFDNFTHGLAIGASYLVGIKVGLLTTFVIFMHEIPHEICDYAILVNSGFTRLDAVKAQSSVSLFGLLGTAIALYVKSLQSLNARTIWILPFSAGGFLYIALVNLLPEILEHDPNRSNTLAQIGCATAGIVFTAFIGWF